MSELQCPISDHCKTKMIGDWVDHSIWSCIFLYPHSYPSGCYRVANVLGPTLLSPSYSLSTVIWSDWARSLHQWGSLSLFSPSLVIQKPLVVCIRIKLHFVLAWKGERWCVCETANVWPCEKVIVERGRTETNKTAIVCSCSVEWENSRIFRSNLARTNTPSIYLSI